MSVAAALIAFARLEGIVLWAHGGNIGFDAPRGLPDDLRAGLLAYKGDVLARLRIRRPLADPNVVRPTPTSSVPPGSEKNPPGVAPIRPEPHPEVSATSAWSSADCPAWVGDSSLTIEPGDYARMLREITGQPPTRPGV